MYVNSSAANKPMKNKIAAALGSSIAQHHTDKGMNAEVTFKIDSFILFYCFMC